MHCIYLRIDPCTKDKATGARLEEEARRNEEPKRSTGWYAFPSGNPTAQYSKFYVFGWELVAESHSRIRHSNRPKYNFTTVFPSGSFGVGPDNRVHNRPTISTWCAKSPGGTCRSFDWKGKWYNSFPFKSLLHVGFKETYQFQFLGQTPL